MKELHALRKELEAAVKPGHAELVDRLLGLLEKQMQRCDSLEKRNRQLEHRIAELENRDPPDSGDSAAPSTSYSVDAEEKRRRDKRRKRRLQSKNKPGRKPKKDKLESVLRWVDVLPENAKRSDCELQSQRVLWRLEGGRAIRVGYRVYRLPWGETPRVPGVLPRCEYGVEIHVLLAFLTYCIGVSINNACQLLHFFCELPLQRSQADAMLTQLGAEWDSDFEDICDQLVASAVVYSDETSWRVGRWNTSLWSFTSELRCVMLYGCSKDRETLESVLPPEKRRPHWSATTPTLPAPANESERNFRNLVEELMRLAVDEQLFEFILDPKVEPTNNLSERQLRSSALARKANRTNKTDTGARRQTRIASVLESLRRSLPEFTIRSVLQRVAESTRNRKGLFSPIGPMELASAPPG